MIQKAIAFIGDVKMAFSVDNGSSIEKRWVFRPDMTYDDFMTECDKMFSFARGTYGPVAFDELMMNNQEKDETAQATENASDKVKALSNVIPFPNVTNGDVGVDE